MTDTGTVQGTTTIRTPACSVSNVKKNFGGVKALVGVDLEIYPGRVHAIVGENGAGKSTLMNVLVGAVQPDEGYVTVNGDLVQFTNVREANQHGIAIVFQELSLFPDLDVLANLFLGREATHLGLISRNEMKRQAAPVLQQIGLSHVSLDRPVGTLNLDEQQLIEIAKALLADSRILILDEPNSALNAGETERLFDVIRDLRDQGTAIIYISHRLEEVFQISDIITVMRNGEVVATLERSRSSISEIVSLMIGRKPTEFYAQRAGYTGERKTLSLAGVTVSGKVNDVCLAAASGEVIGLAGLEGAGVQTIFEVMFGIWPAYEGKIVLPDGKSAPRSVPEAVRTGIAFVPADRRKAGAMLRQSVLENLNLITAGALGRFGFVLRHNRLEERAAKRRQALNIVMDTLDSPVSQLSGGNQQKVVLGKWLEADPDVVLLNDPTRGVDVGAKEDIYRIIHNLADEGRIVLFTSSELPEFVHLCDRVFVFYRGRVAGELPAGALSEQKLLEAINTGQV
jgi:ABC-type sugar transport system ATPase subunit